MGKEWCDIEPNELVLTFEGYHLRANFGKNRSRNATVRVSTDGETHTLTGTNWFNNLSHAICYSQGADNKPQMQIYSGTRRSDKIDRTKNKQNETQSVLHYRY